LSADRIACLLALAACAALRAPTFAQEEPPRPRQVEEIVVTAQKKEQTVQDVPISMTALTGDFLQEAGVDDIHELAKFTPNVNFSTNPCCPTIFIRGFGTPFNASSFDPTVGITIDEMSISQSVYFADPLYDIGRIEVLRGPQGTLFGKNTTGGLFNVTTAAPTREFTGLLVVRAGGLGVHRVEAAGGGPLGALDWAQFRVALLDSQEAGDVDNTKLRVEEPKAKQRAGRLKLALQPLDGLDVLLIGSLARTDARAFQFQQHHLRDSSVRFLRQYDPRFEDDGLNHQDSTNWPPHHVRDTTLAQGNFRYHLGDLGPLRQTELVAVLGYTKFGGGAPIDFDFSPADVAHFLPPATIAYQQKSAELRFGTTAPAPFGFGDLELLTGALYLDSSFFTDVPVVAGDDFGDYLLSAPGFELATGMPAPGGVGFTDLAAAAAALGVPLPPSPAPFAGDGFRVLSDQGTTSAGAFGQLGWNPTPRWTVTAGGRFTYEKRTAALTGDCFNPGFVCAALGAREYNLDLSRIEHDFSPRFTAQYRPFDALTLFAARAQGFKSGGFNNFSITGRGLEVDAEKVVSWETGAKGRLFDGTLSVAAAFFNTDADNLQVQNFVGTAIEVRNAASARSRGVEFDFHWLTPVEPLTLFGAGAFTDARFKDYANALAPRGPGPDTQDLSGKRMPFVSEWQFNVTPTLRLPFAVAGLPAIGTLLPPRLAFTTAVDVFYRSDLFLDLDLDPNTHQDAYVLLNGRIGVSTVDDALSVNVAVRNLANADVFEYVTDSTFFPGGYMAFQEFQRNVVAEVRYHF
jgi:iron complex outermembrane receptor protein